MADDQHETGQEIAGRYRIDELIAAGALCRVHRGTDTVLRRHVVIKAVPRATAPLYRRALQLTAQLTHPAVVATFDAIERDGDLYVVQEYVQARPFETYLRNGLPVERAVDLAGQLARALAYSHHHGVAHGDLTPAALLVDRRAALRVNNFQLPPDREYFSAVAATLEPGLAGVQSQSDDLGVTMTDEMTNDVRAVGLILWQALTTNQDETDETGTRAVSGFRGDVPEPARAVVRHCLSDDHDGAISDAGALVLALEALGRELARGRPTLSVATPPALRVAREMVAREAAWSMGDTPGAATTAWAPAHPGRTQPSVVDHSGATVPAVQRPSGAPGREPRVTAGPARLSLPSRPLGRGDFDVAHRAPSRTAPPVWAAPEMGRYGARVAEGGQRGISAALVIAVGVVLFLLFFVVGIVTASHVLP